MEERIRHVDAFQYGGKFCVLQRIQKEEEAMGRSTVVLRKGGEE